MTRLVLIRHGESNATVRRVAGGIVGCTGLSALGVRQAEALRDRWLAHPEVQPDVLVASNLPRAIDTAEVLRPALGDLPVVIDEDLREMDPGPECDGLDWAGLVERIGSTDWSADPYYFGFPGGETLAGFHHRAASAALAALTRRHEGACIVAVCHGGVIDVALRLFLRTPFSGGFELFTTNTSITDLQRHSSLWRMLRYNDAAHLAGLPAATLHE